MALRRLKKLENIMKISINIPSWKRPDGVRTLDYIPFARVYVDEREAEEYRRNYPDADIVACPAGVQGNLCRVRNYIIDQELNERKQDAALIVDDDLQKIERYIYRGGFGYERETLPTEELLPFLEKYTLLAQDLGAKFWGMNCNSDKMAYRHFTPFSTVAYIGGPFQCFLQGNKCKYDENLPLKENYDMTLQQLNAERVVLRINGYHYVCKQSEQAGGCAMYRNRQREDEQLKMLQRKWGSKIVRRDTTNKGKTKKEKLDDYNPIINIPIAGV